MSFSMSNSFSVSMRAVAAGLALAAAGIAQAAAGGACVARSPDGRQALVELYTSEGCSSCPSADDWLARLAPHRAALRVVPLALHVDYWDGLGWTDRFAQHRFTERQHALASRGGGRFVYTPEVAVAGRELRDWRDASAFERRVVATAGEPARVGIALSAARRADALDVELSVTPRAGAPRALDAYLALYENGIESPVRAGENRGATLRHERVVRQWIGPLSFGPLASTAGAVAPLDVRRTLPLPANLRAQDAARYGVAAFVEDHATGDVLQALDLPLCG
ncbi:MULTISPECIES: DUF1223 domain-containing protein [Burkholderia]|uniref:DUF1223 domain-containing protein n=1 Tax=Burkholderia TaxID=32008 RepID=UPI00075AD37C|nr:MULTISPECIES: DUF1223 domain-containing protein [Burkholderia]AOJ69389.1 hypothetical protein WS78_11965 [Burkholderia savannae]AOK47512.1 hypothetical protein WT60_12165 [Burkholderia sp. MSMB617WGS]KVG37508.1 hypothetical protein WS77_02195 [Burkholderia sp. MSMB0265]KVG88228.1 hypothetical protein WS81_25030 [Burkholderia sp. MSMB2040]KVG93778.1 hypothetical protein WS82_08525 [Burkholderia sp. MSMB2041]